MSKEEAQNLTLKEIQEIIVALQANQNVVSIQVLTTEDLLKMETQSGEADQ